jgi:hypothetical protein
VLELGPEITGFHVFIDFALTFILEAPLAGKMLCGITTKFVVPRVRANQLAKAKVLRVIASVPSLPGDDWPSQKGWPHRNSPGT